MRLDTAILMSAFCLILLSCPRTVETETENTGPTEDQADLLLQGLNSDLPDERIFALLFITRYQLEGYREVISEHARNDMMAAVVLAALHDEREPALDLLRQSAQARASELLGAAYGLRCAGLLAPAFWNAALKAAPEPELDHFLWGLAQLDVEPGGPLALDRGANNPLAQLRLETEKGNTERSAALDALLGGSPGTEVEWEHYVSGAGSVAWNSVQWTALLRWADSTVWHQLLDRGDLNDPTRVALAQALIKIGPTDVTLPGDRKAWTRCGGELEYRASEYVSGRSGTIALPELGHLVTPAEDGAETANELDRAALAAVLKLLEYALLHNDIQAIARAMQVFPRLHPEGQSGILATIERFGSDALNDEQLEALVALDDHTAAYWLVLGWPDREPILKSNLATMLRFSTTHENALLAYAYERWREQHGI